MLGENEEILQALDELRREHRSLDDEVVASFRHFAEYTTLCLTRLVVRR